MNSRKLTPTQEKIESLLEERREIIHLLVENSKKMHRIDVCLAILFDKERSEHRSTILSRRNEHAIPNFPLPQAAGRAAGR